MLRQKVPAEQRAAVDAEMAREVTAAGGGKAHLTGHCWLATATKQRALTFVAVGHLRIDVCH
jgi:hypothetical protein